MMKPKTWIPMSLPTEKVHTTSVHKWVPTQTIVTGTLTPKQTGSQEMRVVAQKTVVLKAKKVVLMMMMNGR